MELNQKVNYYDQDVASIWGGKRYQAYKEGIRFARRDVPYILEDIKESKETVLEIGSSMGQCYRFLMHNNVDLASRFTGTDISNEGIAECQKQYPQANWIQGDFLTTDFPNTYDFVHERDAIHHMPNPLECAKKAVRLGNKKILLNMRSRTYFPTLSDLDKGYYVQFSDDEKEIVGKYFCNVINIHELVSEILTVENVASIQLKLSTYEKLEKREKPTPTYNFVAPDDVFDRKNETLYHCQAIVTKGQSEKPELIIEYASVKQAIKHPNYWLRFLKDRKHILANIKWP